MYVWKFDENRCDFVPVHPAARKTDPDGTYVVSEDDLLYLQEGEQTRRIHHDETLIHVSGQAFDRECFEFQTPTWTLNQQAASRVLSDFDTVSLQAEMKRDGAAMQRWLQALKALTDWVADHVLPVASGPWEQIEGQWRDGDHYLTVWLGLSPNCLLPVLRLDLFEQGDTGRYRVVGTLTAQWSGNRALDVESALRGRRLDLGTWWQRFRYWFDLPVVSAEATLLDEP